MRTELLRFNGAVERDPAIDAWMKEHAGELGAIAHHWFGVMRKCGDEVRELLHDARLRQISRPNFLRKRITTRTRIASPSLCGLPYAGFAEITETPLTSRFMVGCPPPTQFMAT